MSEDEFSAWIDEFSRIVRDDAEAWIYFADRLLADGNLGPEWQEMLIEAREWKSREVAGPSSAERVH